MERRRGRGRPPRGRRRVVIYLRPEVADALAAESARRELSMGDIVEEALLLRVVKFTSSVG